MPEWPSNIITFNLNNIIYSCWAIILRERPRKAKCQWNFSDLFGFGLCELEYCEAVRLSRGCASNESGPEPPKNARQHTTEKLFAHPFYGVAHTNINHVYILGDGDLALCCRTTSTAPALRDGSPPRSSIFLKQR